MTPTELKAIGQRVKKVREHLLLDQSSFADALGITQARVSNMEGGGSVPTPDHIKTLFKKHRVSANYIYHGIPPMVLNKDLTAALKELEQISKSTNALKNIINGVQ